MEVVMGLVPAKCTQCGSSLRIDSSQDAAICEYCRTPFIVEKAIARYNIESAQIHADVVNVNLAKDFEIVAGVLIKYCGAATKVIVPDNVLEIAPDSFTNITTINSVKIPNTVKRIGKPIGNGIFIDNGSFRGCAGLSTINIPDSTEFIMWGAFNYCTSLEEIDISIDKILSLGFSEIQHIFLGSPCSKILIQRLKQECANKNICWSCTAPLELKRNGKCKKCGAKGHLL
jgi:hypothetical protein